MYCFKNYNAPEFWHLKKLDEAKFNTLQKSLQDLGIDD